jgi:hypothetical protein
LSAQRVKLGRSASEQFLQKGPHDDEGEVNMQLAKKKTEFLRIGITVIIMKRIFAHAHCQQQQTNTEVYGTKEERAAMSP